MDISNATNEQKLSAAVAYLSRNTEGAPVVTLKYLERLNKINNEGMEIVKQMNELKKQIEILDSSLGEKIGAGKLMFEIIGEQLNQAQFDEFAKKFDVKQFRPENQEVDMAGSTAKKEAK
jgi:hypothetical protein